jgi:heme exporter protein B
MSTWAQILVVLRKDLLIEWRVRARMVALGCFALTILLLFSFAIGPNTTMLRAHAPAYLWLTVLLSSTLLLGRSLQIEVESGALETVLLVPTAAPAIFYGKALANALQLFALGVVALPAVVVLCDASFREGLLPMLGVLALGVTGLAAPGTLYAGLIARMGASQLLLPLLLFPLVVPCLLGAVKATSLVMTGDPMDQFGSWMGLLLCFDLVYWSLCGLLFGRAIES